MNRREALAQVAFIMGGALSLPAILLDETHAATPAAGGPLFFNDAEGALVAEVAEIMIPRTSTPGAKDAGVPLFIDTMLKGAYSPADQRRYRRGLREFDALARRTHQGNFLALDAKTQAALVQSVHDAAVTDELQRKARHAPITRPFILMTKELTMLGFFTSEIGATQVLQYRAIPGSYHGCIPVSQAGNGKSWAHETSNPF